MPGTIDPANASIDGLIHWLRSQRRINPHSPLPELINLSAISQSRLTDIACIDLIERTRLGQTTQVEDLLRELPSLACNHSARLDLIDAELCVQMELGQTIDLAAYARRFPDLASSIEALTKLNRDASFTLAPVPANTPAPVNTPAPACTPPIASVHPSRASSMLDVHIQPPPWFTREHVQASSERSCLIRGRDSNENRAVALKVIRLPHAISKNEIDSQLAFVEAASMVRHPAWVAPDVAAVEQLSLAVIRPWIFGIRWDQARRHASPQTKLRDLARIGYALQSAHETANNNVYAAHGGIHFNNLLVNSSDEVQIVDAGVSIQPAAGEMLGSNSMQHESHLASNPQRQSDVRSLCALLRLATAGGPNTDNDFRRRALTLDRLCQTFVAEPNDATTCARLADAALKLADGNLNDTNPKLFGTAMGSFWSRLTQRSRSANDPK